MKSVPIFIICWNNGFMVKRTVDVCLKKFPQCPLFVCDNGSTHNTTVSILKELELIPNVTVNYHKQNCFIYFMNKYVPHLYLSDLYEKYCDEYYILTDPDLELENLPEDTIDVLYYFCNKYQCQKAGLALDISDVNDIYSEPIPGPNITIIGHESKYWSGNVNDSTYEAYHAPIDTTFSMRNPNVKIRDPFDRCIRVGGKYKVKHLPWHKSYAHTLTKDDYEYFKMTETGTAKLVKNYVSTNIPELI
jgi:hypothetical protein